MTGPRKRKSADAGDAGPEIETSLEEEAETDAESEAEKEGTSQEDESKRLSSDEDKGRVKRDKAVEDRPSNEGQGAVPQPTIDAVKMRFRRPARHRR
jgi:hypothetical protein